MSVRGNDEKRYIEYEYPCQIYIHNDEPAVQFPHFHFPLPKSIQSPPDPTRRRNPSQAGQGEGNALDSPATQPT